MARSEGTREALLDDCADARRAGKRVGRGSDVRARRRSRLAAAIPVVVVTALLASACNDLLGLTDFEKGPCAGGPCTQDAPDVGVDANDPEAEAAQTEGGVASGPNPWPDFPMPNYAIDAGDADAQLPRQPSYDPPDASGGSIVRDTVTGRRWRMASERKELYTFDEAVRACSSLTGGFWRLPTRIELVSLLDYSGKSKFFIDNAAFPNISNIVWTSSEVRSWNKVPTAMHWAIDFGKGELTQQSVQDNAQAICVQGGS